MARSSNTSDLVYQIQEYNVDVRSSQIYLFGEEGAAEDSYEPGVEFTMANRFIKNLNLLMRKGDQNILIHMKTCGGDWAEGMAIYDAIKACPNYVTIVSYTHARSMSSIILAAADHRVLMPHSTYMIHQGSEGFEGTYKQFQTNAAESVKTLDQMMKIYVDTLKRTGTMKSWSRKRIREFLDDQMNLKEEVYYTAEQAVKIGFADAVFTDWASLR